MTHAIQDTLDRYAIATSSVHSGNMCLALEVSKNEHAGRPSDWCTSNVFLVGHCVGMGLNDVEVGNLLHAIDVFAGLISAIPPAYVDEGGVSPC